jgi:VWFA-related protein
LIASGQRPAPFSVGTSLVVVPVVAVDKKGATVAGMTQEDFQIFEDGKPVEIQTFLAPSGDAVTGEDGRFIVIALDNLFTPAEIAFRVKGIAKRFVDKMGPKDVMSVISLNAGNATTTSSKAELTAAINRFTPAFGEDTMTGAQKAEHGLRMIGALSDQVAKNAHRRKIIVFIGDANMFNPSQPSAFNDRANDMTPEWAEAIRTTSRNNVSVYAIDPGGLGGTIADWTQSFSAETGGYTWSRTNNYGGAVDRIWQESASYYLLGYAAPINDQRIHKIDVKVSKPGVTIRARKARG